MECLHIQIDQGQEPGHEISPVKTALNKIKKKRNDVVVGVEENWINELSTTASPV